MYKYTSYCREVYYFDFTDVNLSFEQELHKFSNITKQLHSSNFTLLRRNINKLIKDVDAEIMQTKISLIMEATKLHENKHLTIYFVIVPICTLLMAMYAIYKCRRYSGQKIFFHPNLPVNQCSFSSILTIF